MMRHDGPGVSAPSEGEGDEQLLRLVARGDDDAFATLVERHRDMVHAVCWRYFRNDSDAQDAVQETFLALYRGAATFTGAAQVSTWLYRVTTNTCHDLLRKRVRRPQATGIDPAWLPTPAQDDIGALELDLDLREALDQLAPAHREVIVLHSLLGLSYAEIAERSGVALGTVKSRIHRAHANLAAVLAGVDREQTDPAGRPMPDPLPPHP